MRKLWFRTLWQPHDTVVYKGLNVMGPTYGNLKGNKALQSPKLRGAIHKS